MYVYLMDKFIICQKSEDKLKFYKIIYTLVLN